jgi:hypothetical protein
MAYLVIAPHPRPLNRQHFDPASWELLVKLSARYQNHAWRGERLAVTPKQGSDRAVWSLMMIKATWNRSYSFRIRQKSIGFAKGRAQTLDGFDEGAPLIVGTVKFDFRNTNEFTIDVPWQKCALFQETESAAGNAEVMLWLAPSGQTHASVHFYGATAGAGPWAKPKNLKPYFGVTKPWDADWRFGLGWLVGGSVPSK